MHEELDPETVVIHRHGHEISFSGNLKDAIFQRSVKKYKNRENFSESFDNINEYKTNNYGFRGPDFRSGVDIVAAGCSQTYGVGVPEETTWPAFLAEKLGMSYVNISGSGASVEWIVQSLFSYFYEFGNPKIVAVLVPDLFRTEVFVDNVVNTTREVSNIDFAVQGMDEEFKRGILTCRSLELDINWRAKLGRRPFHIEDTIPVEEAIVRSFKHLAMLEQYCKSSGIILRWTGWSDDVNYFIEDYADRNYFDYAFLGEESSAWKSSYTDEEVEPDYKLYHGTNPECTAEVAENNCICYGDCHSELEKKYPKVFHYGADKYARGIGNSHLGVHRHVHLAMDFYKEVTSAIDS